MKKIIHLCCVITFLLTGAPAFCQKVDSIFFNLYTDSLKKGTYNYINVDGKLSDGRYLPMTTKEISLSASAGKFDGNSLYLPSDFKDEKVNVKAVLKTDTAFQREITIYIKKVESTERLKTLEEVMGSGKKKRSSRGG